MKPDGVDAQKEQSDNWVPASDGDVMVDREIVTQTTGFWDGGTPSARTMSRCAVSRKWSAALLCTLIFCWMPGSCGLWMFCG